MGMDVYGKDARSEAGKYFRNNVWWWGPLASYIEEVAPPALVQKCRYWHSNDCDGLNDEDSRALADVLQAEVDSGRTKGYELANTGESYPFSTENVQEFIAFLRDCGGFEIC